MARPDKLLAVMWTRLLLVLMLLLAPAAALADPWCGPEPAADDCCTPQGECPAAPDGDCVMIALALPAATVPAASLSMDGSLQGGCTVAMNSCEPPTLRIARTAPGRPPDPPSLVLTLHTLRN